MQYIVSKQFCCVTFPLLVLMLSCVFEEVCLSIKIVCDIVDMNTVYNVVYNVVYYIVYDIVYDVNMIPVDFCLKNDDRLC